MLFLCLPIHYRFPDGDGRVFVLSPDSVSTLPDVSKKGVETSGHLRYEKSQGDEFRET